MNAKSDEILPSSGNVFADLQWEDAQAHLVKADLVARIEEIVRRRRLTAADAAEILGLPEAELSALVRGDIRRYSVERLLSFVMALGRDVEIVIGRTSSRRRRGRLTVQAA
jgi:predicted XRE-type DNA-binding protein